MAMKNSSSSAMRENSSRQYALTRASIDIVVPGIGTIGWSTQQVLVLLDHLGLLPHHVPGLLTGQQLQIFAGLLHLLPQQLVLERLGECARQHGDPVVGYFWRGHGVPDLIAGRDSETP